MSSRILRNLVAGPRMPHPEANLDLCYVTENIIATSGPSSSYPSLAYRNPLDALVKYLDQKHGQQWCIWEFRAEGTGYPDEAVYNRIFHFPWPDHHPPPFALIPRIMASMRDWLQGRNPLADKPAVPCSAPPHSDAGPHRVVVVHCKAGKGRSGSMAISYLLSEEAWTLDDALRRFTERRMRPGFGAGISIPSQLRWLSYVDRWRCHGKLYLEQQVDVLEVRVWGLRPGVKVAIEGFADAGRRIQVLHTFKRRERDDFGTGDDTEDESAAEDEAPRQQPTQGAQLVSAFASVVTDVLRQGRNIVQSRGAAAASRSRSRSPAAPQKPVAAAYRALADPSKEGQEGAQQEEVPGVEPRRTTSASEGTKNVIYRPTDGPVRVPTNEINLAVERRSKAPYGVGALVTSVAHVWFNCFFEGNGPEQMAGKGAPDGAGVFEIEWDAMDGIKGSARKGTRAFDRVAVVWRVAGVDVPATRPAAAESEKADAAATESGAAAQAPPEVKIIREPSPGAPVLDAAPADWRYGKNQVYAGAQGLEVKAAPHGSERESASSSGEMAHDLTVKGSKEKLAENNSDEEGAEGLRRGVRMPEE